MSERVPLGFTLAWLGFQIMVWALALILIKPATLRIIGWDSAAAWLRDHVWVRWLSAPVLLPLVLLSAFQPRAVRRVDPDEADAPEGGGSPAGFGIDPGLGMTDGPIVRWRLRERRVEAATWSLRGKRRCVARADVALCEDFAFAAHSSRHEPGWLQGANQMAVGMALRQAARDRPDGAAAAEAVSFLSRAPLDLSAHPLAGSVVLRSNRPDLARRLLSSGEIVRILTELDGAGRRWELSLLPAETPGRSRLSFECRGRLQDPLVAAGVRGVMDAALAEIDGSGAAAPPANVA